MATESGYNNSSRDLREDFSTYQTLLGWIENEEYVVKGSSQEGYGFPLVPEDKSDPKNCMTENQFPIGRQNLTQRLFAVIGKRMIPHFFVVFQWALLLFGVMSFIDFPIIIPGSRANGELKVVMTSHLWVLFFSTISCFLFYKNRRRRAAEKAIFNISLVAALFSIAHFILHFINNFLFLMWFTGIISWIFYLLAFSISIYSLLDAFLKFISKRARVR